MTIVITIRCEDVQREDLPALAAALRDEVTEAVSDQSIGFRFPDEECGE